MWTPDPTVIVTAAQRAAEADAVPYRLYKSVFISRLTSDEAETMEVVLAAADAKLRLMFNSVEYFISDDPLFATLTDAVGAALTPSRADELLSRSPLTVINERVGAS